MLTIAERWFERRAMADGVTWLFEPHVDSFLRCNIWHVRGRDRDLVVDTGSGLSLLRNALADLVKRPLIAAATHIHRATRLSRPRGRARSMRLTRSI